MARSMTGYGRGEAIATDIRVSVEARSVNHRFSEIVVRMPRYLMVLEERIRKRVSEDISRGRIDLGVSIERSDGRQKSVSLNVAVAKDYYAGLAKFSREHGLGRVSLADITVLPDVFTVEDCEIEPESAWPFVLEAVGNAIDALVAMREREGANLVADLRRRVQTIAAHLAQIENRSPLVVEEYRERLSNRVREIMPGQIIDEARLASEIVLFAERASITEEIVRAKSHIDQLDRTIGVEGSIGRKLEFLLQEINREVNTISSKSSDLVLADNVVSIKSELEKIREQVQNLE